MTLDNNGYLSISSDLTGIRQSTQTNSYYGNYDRNNNQNQTFGNSTQVRVSNKTKDLITVANNDLDFNINLIGIDQSVNYSSTNSTDHSNSKRTQNFGDATRVDLSSEIGDVSAGSNSRVILTEEFTGILQNSRNYNSSIDNHSATSTQLFGNDTQIIVSNSVGELVANNTGDIRESAIFQTNVQAGVRQSNYDNSDYHGGNYTNSSNQTFGDRTQISLSNKSGNLILNELATIFVNSNYFGIDQIGNFYSSYSDDETDVKFTNNQFFGNDTKIEINEKKGDVVFQDDGYLYLSFYGGGINQTNNYYAYEYGGDHYLESDSNQTFGDQTQILVSEVLGDVNAGNLNDLHISSRFYGVMQSSTKASSDYSENSSTRTSNQTFGNNTQIKLDTTMGHFNAGDSSVFTVNSIRDGIGQSVSDGSRNNGKNSNNTTSQTFGENTQVLLKNLIGDFVYGDTSSIGLNYNFNGVYQNTSLNSEDASLSTQNTSQSFGNKTQVVLENKIGNLTFGESGTLYSTSWFNGVNQLSDENSDDTSNNLNNISNQVFGDDTQITLDNTIQNITSGNNSTLSLYSRLSGIDQMIFYDYGGTSTNKVDQTFGNNTQVFVNNTVGNLIAGDNSDVYINSNNIGVIQSTYDDRSLQSFGDNTQIKVNSAIGDLTKSSGDLYLNSYQIGIGQNSDLNKEGKQNFGDNTFIEVDSKIGAINNPDYTLIRVDAKGIEQSKLDGQLQMHFGTGTQIRVHAEVGAINNVTDLDSNSIVNAYGVYSDGTAETDLIFEGDLSIQSTVKPLILDGNTLKDRANAYSLFATNDGQILLNDQGVNKITLVGDLGTGDQGDSNKVTVYFSNDNSYLQGNVKATSGNIYLTLANGAIWRPQGDGDVEAAFGTSGGHLDLQSGGIVDMAWWNNQDLSNPVRTFSLNRAALNPSNQFRTLTIDQAILADGGIFRVNSDVLQGNADRINISNASGSGAQYIQVAYDTAMNGSSGLLQAIPGNEPVVLDIQGGTAPGNVTGKIYQSDSPLYQYEIDPLIIWDGTQAKIGSIRYGRTERLSETPYTIVDAQTAFRNLWKMEGNNLMNRMGELRLSPEKNSTGAWARVYSGKLSSDSAYLRNFDQKYAGMQVGYDQERSINNGKLYTGVVFNYLDSDPSYRSGSGKLYSKGLGIYGSWIGKNNHYVDVVLRGSKLNNEYRLIDNGGQVVSGNYDAWAYGASAEYGYRAHLKNKWFMEPQVEISLGHIGSGNHKTDSGLTVHQSSINTAQSRIGLLVGKDFGSENKKGNAYLRTSWIQDFGGNGSIDGYYHGDQASLKTLNQRGSHFEVNLGANVKLNKKLDSYFEVSKSFGGKVETNWQVNGGIRLSW